MQAGPVNYTQCMYTLCLCPTMCVVVKICVQSILGRSTINAPTLLVKMGSCGCKALLIYSEKREQPSAFADAHNHILLIIANAQQIGLQRGKGKKSLGHPHRTRLATTSPSCTTKPTTRYEQTKDTILHHAFKKETLFACQCYLVQPDVRPRVVNPKQIFEPAPSTR